VADKEGGTVGEVTSDPAGGREAEIEAVARALRNEVQANGAISRGATLDACKVVAVGLVDALDAVRTGSAARNREEWKRVEGASEEVYARSPQSEDRERCLCRYNAHCDERPGCQLKRLSACSPQSEDHEQKGH